MPVGFMQDAGCLAIDEDGAIGPLTMGRVASFYYLKYQTMGTLHTGLRAGMTVPEVPPTRPSFSVPKIPRVNMSLCC